jgi:hypothetical protein
MTEHLAHDVDLNASWLRRDIRVVTTDKERACVLHVQKAMGWAETGELDDGTCFQLKGLQSLFGLVPTGYLDLATARQVEAIREYGSVEG